MNIHELVYKLVGNRGCILEIASATDQASQWQERVTSASPLLSWKQTTIRALTDAKEDQLVWFEVNKFSEHERIQILDAFHAGKAQALIALIEPDDSVLASFIQVLPSQQLFAQGVVPIGGAETGCRGVVIKRYAGADQSLQYCKAMSELAVLRYLETTPERIEIRRMIEEEQSHRLQLEARTSLAREWQTKAEALRTRVHQLAHELDEKDQAFSRLTKEASQATRELLIHKKREAHLKQSFSYRFGNLFALAARNPRRLPLLPVDFLKLIIGAIRKRSRSIRKARLLADTQKKQAPKAPQVMPAGESKHFDSELQVYLDNQNASESETIATITHPLTTALLEPVTGTMPLHPNTWQADLQNASTLVVDSYMLLQNTPWQQCLSGAPLGYPGHLIDVLGHCKREKIPSVLLLTCQPDHCAELSDILPLFDHVIAPSGVNLDDMARALFGQTRITRSGWPIADERNALALAQRTRTGTGVLSTTNGEVFLQPAQGENPRRLYVSTEPARIDEVYGLPIMFAPGQQLDLRAMELIAKGSVPIFSKDSIPPGAAIYQLLAGESDTAWATLANEQQCLNMARQNIVLAATTSSVSKVFRTLAHVTGGGAQQIVANKLYALIVLEDDAHIPLIAATLERQDVLPGKVIIFPAHGADSARIMHALSGQLPQGVSIDVASRSTSLADYVRRYLNEKNEEIWHAVMVSSYHYANAHLATIRTLSHTGLAPAYARKHGTLFEGATLAFSSECSPNLADTLQRICSGQERFAPPSELQVGEMMVDFADLAPDSLPSQTEFP